MPRRRRSPIRALLGLTATAGVVVAAGAGVIVLRDYLTAAPVVLSVESAADPDPPQPILDSALVERTVPRSIAIESLGVDHPVHEVGLTVDGELEVPDETEVGWWEHGGAPGLPGATVLAAHVSWNGAIGPFHRLGDVEIGDLVAVDTGRGFVRTYQVVERTMYPKDELPNDRIWRTTGPETLVLITCGGDFNPDIRRYRHNIVVFAIPIDERPVDPTLVPGSSVPTGDSADAADDAPGSGERAP